MKKYFGFSLGFFGFILSAFFLPAALSAETLEAPSKITDVTVYADRALVTRRAELNLSQGAHSIKISPLPAFVEENSISAKGEGTAKVALFGAKLATVQLEKPQSERVKEIQEEIKKLSERRQAVVDSQTVQQKKLEFLESIKAASVEQIGKDIITKQPSVADISQLAAFLDKELSSAFEKIRTAAAELREIDEKIDALKRELKRLRGENQKQETAIVVDLEAKTEGAFVLEVTYRLPGATWEPVYEARTEGGAAQVQLIEYGLIKQRTGEDWTEATLRLSTAKPAIGGRMPEIEPWFIKKYEPPVARPMMLEAKRMAAPVGAMKATMAESRNDELPPAPEQAEMASAAVESKGPAMLFTLPKKETILCDWQPRKAVIASAPLPATLAYETTPRLSPYAYLRAKVKNNPESVLLAGPVQIFLDGTFVGNSSIDLIGPGEEFDLFLGIDERIHVERKQLKAKTDVSFLPGLHGRVKSIDYVYLTTIQNNGAAPVDVTVIDQIPVSQNDEIKVKPLEFEPKPTEQDAEKPGVERWKLSLTAGEKKQITSSYRVSYPADIVIEGL